MCFHFFINAEMSLNQRRQGGLWSSKYHSEPRRLTEVCRHISQVQTAQTHLASETALYIMQQWLVLRPFACGRYLILHKLFLQLDIETPEKETENAREI